MPRNLGVSRWEADRTRSQASMAGHLRAKPDRAPNIPCTDRVPQHTFTIIIQGARGVTAHWGRQQRMRVVVSQVKYPSKRAAKARSAQILWCQGLFLGNTPRQRWLDTQWWSPRCRRTPW
jgi:hypothetical protein